MTPEQQSEMLDVIALCHGVERIPETDGSEFLQEVDAILEESC